MSATGVIDCDQHLFESRTLWADYADPNRRDQALQIVDDAAGNAWLEWQGRRMVLADGKSVRVCRREGCGATFDKK